jgi:hypothetical protein
MMRFGQVASRQQRSDDPMGRCRRQAGQFSKLTNADAIVSGNQLNEIKGSVQRFHCRIQKKKTAATCKCCRKSVWSCSAWWNTLSYIDNSYTLPLWPVKQELFNWQDRASQ